MDVKSAVNLAINHVRDLFDQESITNLGLEEIEYDADMQEWVVTVGFSRPWDYPKDGGIVSFTSEGRKPNRSFKIVIINNKNEEVLSIKNYKTSDE